MRLPLFAITITLFVTGTATAQSIEITYKNDKGDQQSVIVTQDTKSIVISGTANFRDFSISPQDFPDKTTLVFRDGKGTEIKAPDQKNPLALHSARVLNNTIITILTKTGDATKQFVQVKVFDQLTPGSMDVTTRVAPLLQTDEAPCKGCDYIGRQMVYDYAKDTLGYSKTGNPLRKRRMAVGQPFSFKVININPFRDSVVISSETADFNTDVPDLFTKAFFQPSLQGTEDPTAVSRRMAILADLFALGQQIEKEAQALRETKECFDICPVVAKVKSEAEEQFKNLYKFDKAQSLTLVNFLVTELKDVPDVYKDSVAAVIRRYQTFVSARNYYYYNIPQVQNVDAYIFTLSVLPRYGLTSNVVVDHQPITARTVGGLKFDFSTGLFITGLRNERYNLNPDSSVILNSYGGDSIVYNRRNQIVRQSETSPVDFGVSALMHLYPRMSPTFNVSLTLGAGLSIGPNPSIRYLGGGSVLLGRNGRFVVTYGCAAGFTDVLADGYKNGQYVALTDKTALTKKAFNTASFVSLSFSLPIKKSSVNTQSSSSSSGSSSSGSNSSSGGSSSSDSSSGAGKDGSDGTSKTTKTVKGGS